MEEFTCTHVKFLFSEPKVGVSFIAWLLGSGSSAGRWQFAANSLRLSAPNETHGYRQGLISCRCASLTTRANPGSLESHPFLSLHLVHHKAQHIRTHRLLNCFQEPQKCHRTGLTWLLFLWAAAGEGNE